MVKMELKVMAYRQVASLLSLYIGDFKKYFMKININQQYYSNCRAMRKCLQLPDLAFILPMQSDDWLTKFNAWQCLLLCKMR